MLLGDYSPNNEFIRCINLTHFSSQVLRLSTISTLEALHQLTVTHHNCFEYF